MGVLSRLRGTDGDPVATATVERLKSAVSQREDSLELLQERLAELELALEDEGWVRLGLEGELDFSLDGIRKIIRMSRLMYLKNPLVRRSVRVQAFYVFGQGMQIRPHDDRVKAVVDRFLADPANQKVLTRHGAQRDREIDLQVEGQLFLAMFVNQASGEVKVRFLPVLEIEDIVSNPDDVNETWWYKRVWTERRVDPATGRDTTEQRTLYYRDWQVPDDKGRLGKVGEAPVASDVWVMHVKVGALAGMRFGVPETYAALDWARAYKTYLENWASIAKALSRFAWRLRGKSRQVRKAKSRLDATGEGELDVTNPPPGTGSVALTPEAVDFEAIPKTGAQVSADDGLQLRKMVAAATDTPDPILSNDPQQGTLATARTLDRPTELGMRDRQIMWADIFRDLLGFVVEKARVSPGGRLREAQRENGDGMDLAVEVTFPPLLERDIRDSVRAVVDAYTMGGRPPAGLIPPKLATRMLLLALGVENIDETVREMFPDGDGEMDPAERADLAAAMRDVRVGLNQIAEAVGS